MHQHIPLCSNVGHLVLLQHLLLLQPLDRYYLVRLVLAAQANLPEGTLADNCETLEVSGCHLGASD